MITTPSLVLDEQKCKKNIEEMFEKAQRNIVDFRPHFKTHQSKEIGRWFKQLGVDKITVSSLSMAEYFSDEWNDITVAFPANILEIDRINKLGQTVNLQILVESTDTVQSLRSHIKYNAGFFIKIDVGYNRTGINPKNIDKIDGILHTAKEVSALNFKGFLAHAGHTYKCRSKEEVLMIHNESVSRITKLRERYETDFPDLIISVGDTPSCSIAEDFSMVDEIRPGNFVFYDLSQEQIGSCEFNQIAVAEACPIVAIHEERNEIVIYGGGVHLSKERLEHHEFGTIYGLVAEKQRNRWGDPIPKTFVKSLSQEHGIISAPAAEISKYKLGDCLMILPVHSCMTANLMDYYLSTDNTTIPRI